MNIVITGASKGLGKAIAQIFAADEQGHNLFLCARTKEELENTGKELQARFLKTNIHTKTCDVADKKQLADFVKWIKTITDKVDMLVNNAGIYLPGSAHGEEDGVLEIGRAHV